MKHRRSRFEPSPAIRTPRSAILLALALAAASLSAHAARQQRSEPRPVGSGDQLARPIWPDQLGDWKRASIEAVTPPDQAILDEYGLTAVERAEYLAAKRRIVATGYRFRDAIGGYAGYLLLRPGGAQTSNYTEIAAQSGDVLVALWGNYVLRFEKDVPPFAVFEQLLAYLPEMDQTPLPLDAGVLPPSNRVPNSERMILGPVSLARFAAKIPPSVAAFRLGAMGLAAEYSIGGAPISLDLFVFPAPPDASGQCAAFQKLPGTLVNCTGKYVAVAMAPRGDPGAQALLRQIPYTPPRTPVAPGRVEAGRAGFWGVVAVLLAGGLALGWWLHRKLSRTPAADPRLTLRS